MVSCQQQLKAVDVAMPQPLEAMTSWCFSHNCRKLLGLSHYNSCRRLILRGCVMTAPIKV